MQYAALRLDGGAMVLIDIHEHMALDRHLDGIKDLEEDEDSMPYKLVYGGYLPQPDLADNPAAAAADMGKAKGFGLGHVKEDGCRAIELVDFEAYAPVERMRSITIPFAALIRTHVELPENDRQAVTAFVRYWSQMTPATNILNRRGLFAIKAQERRTKGMALTPENWKQFIDTARAHRAARKAV